MGIHHTYGVHGKSARDIKYEWRRNLFKY